MENAARGRGRKGGSNARLAFTVGRVVGSPRSGKAGRGNEVAAWLAVHLEVASSDGTKHEQRRVTCEGLASRSARLASQSARSVEKQKNGATLAEREKAARQVARGSRPDRLAELLSAIGHHQRLRILLKLLGGEATHQLLSKVTGLKAGPLYYHLRELRSAGLIGPRVRDLYVLTPKGRRAILAALAVERMCR